MPYTQNNTAALPQIIAGKEKNLLHGIPSSLSAFFMYSVSIYGYYIVYSLSIKHHLLYYKHIFDTNHQPYVNVYFDCLNFILYWFPPLICISVLMEDHTILISIAL